jgi:beta-phosphoglucomutase-like phosphatase (HAD superfamily)
VPVPKPDPGVYLLAAKELGVDPRLCVAVEDSLPGATAAAAAGLAPIIVANPFTAPTLKGQTVVPPERVVLDGADGEAYERALRAACAEVAARRAALA